MGEDRNLCAESFRFSLRINVVDRIDEGPSLLYYLRERDVCAEVSRLREDGCAEWCTFSLIRATTLSP